MRRASRWYRQVVQKLSRGRRPARTRLRIESLEAREVPHISGTVFVDLNLDGVQDIDDVGAAGVTVSGLDAEGKTESTITDANGLYELEMDADDVRIAFSGFPINTMPGRVTDNTGGVVRFLNVDSDRSAVDLALTAPQLVTTQFFYDDASEGVNAGEGAVVSVPYGTSDIVFPNVLATVAEVGSVWGLAYQPSSNSIYTSSFVKRHAGLGPNQAGTGTTTGGIYRINRAVDPVEVSLLVDLNTEGPGFGAGADPHPGNPADTGTNDDWFHDLNTLPVVGKRGLGGLAITPDGRNLYVMNLNTRELVRIPLNADGTLDESRRLITTPTPLANPAGSGITGFNSNDLRPFAVVARGNAIFVGVTYSSENSQSASSLRAFVYAYDPVQEAFRTYNQTTGTFATAGVPTPVLVANLTYQRGVADDPTPGDPGDEVSANWRPWTAGFDLNLGQEGFPVHPEPWLTDIAFDGDAMVLAIRDRFGDQGGFDTGNGSAGNEDFFSTIASGDVLRAAPNGTGGWILESGGASGGVTTNGAGNGQGPGGGEYYFDDGADPSPQDVAMGALAQVPGFGTIAFTGADPGSAFAGGVYTLFNTTSSTGLPTATVAGAKFAETLVYESLDSNTFGSANGLGDLLAVPTIGTVQAGHRIFADANDNGIQDPAERGIPDVAVRLFLGGNQMDSVVSGAGGDFRFDNLLPNTAYEFRIDTAQSALSRRNLARGNQGADDLIDSDAVLNGSSAVVAFTTGLEGSSVLALDIGFLEPRAGVLTLGNLIFRDNNGNGTFETGDVGIDGVLVELLDGTGTPIAGQTATTAGGGLYTFVTLDPGSYQVRLAASNFNTGGVLAGFTNAAGSVTSPENNANNDNNGITTGTLGSGGVIGTGTIILADDSEPTNDGDSDANTNLTLDIGLVAPPIVGTLTLGNRVFRDNNGSGTFDTGDVGIDGVALELLDGAGTPISGQTTTTAGGGLYSFTGLVDGTYRVRIAASNFNTGAVLEGFTNATGSVANPDNDADNDNNGIVTGTLGSGGVIGSGSVTLADDGEPTTDGDTNADTNLTLDFGLVAPAAAGTLTLGNLVFRDVTNNGVFDTGDTGIDGVLVELLDGAGTPIAGKTTTTSGGGLYSFFNLVAGSYQVRIAASNFNTGNVLAGFTSSASSSADPNDDANNDDNGVATGTLGSGGVVQSGTITLSANGEPTNDGDASDNTNLSLDFGFVPPAAAGTLTLGNLVWNDANDDGQFGTGEAGIDGVVVELLDGNATPVPGGTTTTAGGGLYTFTNLAAGAYRVRLAASNFDTGGVLFGRTSSAFTSGNTDDNTNNNDDGAVSGILGSGGFIISGAIVLAANGEPTNDGDADNNTNLTVDFGVVTPLATGPLTLGNLVFRDINNDGTFNGTDTGIAGVLVELLDVNGTAIPGRTTTSAANGLYTFANLPASTYRVRLAAVNFNTGGILAGFTSSTFTAGTPNDDVNNNDDGDASGTLGSGGFIVSGPITLIASNEPTTDGDTDANTNLTLDFGVVPGASTGTLSVGNLVWNDTNNDGQLNNGESGIANVTVQLVSPTGTIVQSAITNSSGVYSFTGVAPGDYRVRLPGSNFLGTGTLVGFVSSTGANGAATGPFEGASLPDPDTIPADNDDNGQVVGTLGQVNGGVETLLFTLAIGTEPTDDGDGNPDTNFGIDLGVFRKFSIGNVVFNDLDNDGAQDPNETGLQNVSVRLLNAANGNAQVATATTNTLGQYLFSNLSAGSYIVELAANNFNAGGVLASFKSSTGAGNTFEPAPAPTADRTDVGTTSGTLGSGGVIRSSTLVLGPAAAQPTGEAPNTDTATPDNQANLRFDFGLFQQTPAQASVSGRVFLDYNDNGIFNGPDSGLSGVSLSLSGGNLTAPQVIQTDSLGNFTFTNLAAGTYTITQTQPTTPANQSGKTSPGSAGGSNSALNVISNIVLGANEAATNYRFAEIPIISTGGSVFEDSNGDGIKNSGEPGIPGVTITLTGNSVVAGTIDPRTATTDANGNYTFNDLTPGTYTITESTQPTGYIDGKEQNGTPAAANVTNDRFAGINLTTTAAPSTGFNFGEVKTGGLAGVVYEDANNDGAQATTGEPGIANVRIRLTGTNDRGQSINLSTLTGANGAFSFANLRPGTYRLVETQPKTYRDGKDTAGTAGGNATAINDQISNIQLTSSGAATGYLFGEQATADVVVTQSPGSGFTSAGGTITMTFTARNRGTAAAAGVEVLVNYGGMLFVSASTPADFNTTTRRWNVGDLAPGASETIRITFRAPGAGSFGPSSRISTTSTEISTANNTATSSIFAGISAPTPAAAPVVRNFWFLASSTNAYRSSPWWWM